jgi:hypothetical protein
MAKFKVDEQAKIIRTSYPILLDKECTIIALIDAPLFDERVNEQWYAVAVNGIPSGTANGNWIGAESCFEKRLPTGRELFEFCLKGSDLVQQERKKVTSPLTKAFDEVFNGQ